MDRFRFFHPIEIRYGDLDPQGHVNNAKFLTYFEQTRVAYLMRLGLFSKDQSFLEVGIILAEARVTYLLPVGFGTQIHVGARATRLGNKSFEMAYSLQETISGQELATGSAILVAFDYHAQQSIPIPEKWRTAIRTFENGNLQTGKQL
jgi:acyl-CoA thioester hydrolase